MGDKMNWAKYRYYMNRKLERRNNRTLEQKIEHSVKEMESKRRKREMEFDKFLKEKYNIDKKEDWRINHSVFFSDIRNHSGEH